MEDGKNCSIERLGSGSGSECCGRNHGSHFPAPEVADTSVEEHKLTRNWVDQPCLSSSVDQIDDRNETAGREVEKRREACCARNAHEHPPQAGAEDSCHSHGSRLRREHRLAIVPPL